MSQAGDTTGPDADASRTAQASSLSRRRLLRGGIAAAPVILTVAPGSVLAGTSCTTASAFASLNASRTSSLPVCSGHKPDWWCANTGSWPTSSCTPNTKFQDCGFAVHSSFSGMTKLLDVLKFTETSGHKCVAKHIVAALLNAKTGITPPEVLNEAKVKAVWNEFCPNGWFVPTAGIKWYDVTPTVVVGKNPGGVTGWLQTTMS
jgi:hypothetical protein